MWATTSDDGFPDISFRGSTFVFDDEHIAFWDRSFGASTTNLENNPHVCMLFYDKENRLGWRFYGTATVYKDGDIRQQIMRRTVKGELDKDPERKATACSCGSTKFAATAALTSCKSGSRRQGRLISNDKSQV